MKVEFYWSELSIIILNYLSTWQRKKNKIPWKYIILHDGHNQVNHTRIFPTEKSDLVTMLWNDQHGYLSCISNSFSTSYKKAASLKCKVWWPVVCCGDSKWCLVIFIAIVLIGTRILTCNGCVGGDGILKGDHNNGRRIIQRVLRGWSREGNAEFLGSF